MTPSNAPAGVDRSPAAAWSLRVRRVGGFIQLAFAAFWLMLLAFVVDWPWTVAIAAMISLGPPQ